VYEPTTVEIDRTHGEGDYRSYSLYFVGRLVRMVEAGHITMRLYEWADQGGSYSCLSLSYLPRLVCEDLTRCDLGWVRQQGF
jgi:hypothetical protein